jgi:hypothetical protein
LADIAHRQRADDNPHQKHNQTRHFGGKPAKAAQEGAHAASTNPANTVMPQTSGNPVLVHNAHRIDLAGDSLRRRRSISATRAVD